MGARKDHELRRGRKGVAGIKPKRRSITPHIPYKKGNGGSGGIKGKKPKGMEDWLTVNELALEVDRSVRTIRKLAQEAERGNPSRFPIAKRVAWGSLQVRLFSPRMVDEARAIFEYKIGARRKGYGEDL